jgi:hypothetical protein
VVGAEVLYFEVVLRRDEKFPLGAVRRRVGSAFPSSSPTPPEIDELFADGRTPRSERCLAADNGNEKAQVQQ